MKSLWRPIVLHATAVFCLALAPSHVLSAPSLQDEEFDPALASFLPDRSYSPEFEAEYDPEINENIQEPENEDDLSDPFLSPEFVRARSARSDGKMQFMRLGRALAAPAAVHNRDLRAQQAFMRIGRSAAGSKPSMYTRIGQAPAPAGVYTRIGRSAAADEEGKEDDIYARDTRSSADMYTRLGRAPQLYTRIGRAAPNKQQMYMRIGRAGGAANQFMRIGRAANKQFMRIGRAGASRQFTRIGRAANQQFMRIGRAPQLYTRIGRSYFRTGRASHLYTRMGRSNGAPKRADHIFTRIGRSGPKTDLKRQGLFTRMGRSSSPAAAVASYQQPDSLPDMYNNLHQSEDMSDINYADPDFDLYSSNMAAAESADPEDFPAFSGDIDDDFYNSHYGAMENNEDDLDNDIVGFANESNANDKNENGLNGKKDKIPKSKS